jgi:hypothetical protein
MYYNNTTYEGYLYLDGHTCSKINNNGQGSGVYEFCATKVILSEETSQCPQRETCRLLNNTVKHLQRPFATCM